MSTPDGELRPPWAKPVLDLLRSWERRAGTSAELHHRIAGDLGRWNIYLGIPVVVLTAVVGTGVFATLQETVDTRIRIFAGAVSVAAAILASLQMFLRFGERAEQHRVAAERWSALRREIEKLRSLHPEHPLTQADPKPLLDDLQNRIDEVADKSPAMGERRWHRAQRRSERMASRARPARS